MKKTLHKLIFFILIFFLSIFTVLADFDIGLKIDKEKVELGETFNLSIKVVGTGSIDNVTVLGIRDFDILGKRQSKSVTSINGDKKQSINIVFNLKSSSIGDYNLGPVVLKIGDNKIQGEEKIKIKVLESIISISDKKEENIEKNQVEEKEKSNKIKEEKETIKNKKDILTKKDGEKETDIIENLNDINPIKNYILKINFYFIFIIIFFIVFYFLLKALLGQKDKTFKRDIEKKKKEISKSVLIKLKLMKLRENIKTLNKTEFYAIINMLFREHFEYLGERDASKKTYEELKNTDLKEKKIFGLFKKSYFNEFDNKKDNKDSRKKIIDKFIKRIEK